MSHSLLYEPTLLNEITNHVDSMSISRWPWSRSIEGIGNGSELLATETVRS